MATENTIHHRALAFSKPWEREVNDADVDALRVDEDGSVVQGQGHRGAMRGLHQHIAHMQITMLKAQDLLGHSQCTRHLLEQADGLGSIPQLGKLYKVMHNYLFSFDLVCFQQ